MADLTLKRFYGINTKVSDIDLAIGESFGLTNVNLTEESLEQRFGSELISTNIFVDSGANPVPITGLFSDKLNGVVRQVGTGGDRFQEFIGGAWVNVTGAVTLTSNPNLHTTFTKFKDNAADDVYIIANGTDAPIKWTGVGNAVALVGPPGNFQFQAVHKNKLWVNVDQIVYFSAILDGETWNLTRDVIAFSGNGGAITGIVPYNDRLVVFQNKSISMVYGSEYRDIYVEEVVSGEGCVSGFSPVVINSRRLGTVIIYLSSDGYFKAFNGTRSPVKIGEVAQSPLFSSMNPTRWPQAIGVDYEKRNQYWLAMTYGSGATNDQVVLYDYFNDVHSHPTTGRAISTVLNHENLAINAAAIFESANGPILVTGDYEGRLLQQDSGLNDIDNETIEFSWLSSKIDFGDPTHVKLVVDQNVLTTQYSDTNLELRVSSDQRRGISEKLIRVNGNSRWGTMIWGVGRWAANTPVYTRMAMVQDPATDEGGVYGRYIQFQFLHSTPNERLKIEEFLMNITDLGEQQEYIET